MRVVVVTSSLPCGPVESFILPEVTELRRLGHEVLMVPMWPRGEPFHEAARDLVAHSRIRPVLDLGIAMQALGMLFSRPWTVGGLLAVLVRESRSRDVVLKNLAVFPKGLWLGACARRWRADHLHAYWAGGAATMGWLAAKLAGIPFSVTAFRWDIAENNLLTRKTREATFVRVADRAGAAELAAYAGPDTPPPVVIHSGVTPPARIPSPRDEIDPLRIVLPAVFVEKKGHCYLVDALARLAASGVSVRCEFAGEGPLLGDIRGAITRAGLDARVGFLGMLPHAVWLDKLQSGSWDAVVMPSVETPSGEKEGIPVSLVEAMACGVPVITTDAGGMPELLEGDAGILVAQRDPEALARAIAEFARDAGLRRRLHLACLARIRAGFMVSAIGAELARRIGEAPRP